MSESQILAAILGVVCVGTLLLVFHLHFEFCALQVLARLVIEDKNATIANLKSQVEHWQNIHGIPWEADEERGF